MPRFEHCFEVNAPLEAVAEFHRDARALRRLTPPPMWAQFHRVEPLGEGSKAEFTLWLGRCRCAGWPATREYPR